MKKTRKIPKRLQPYLWSVDIKNLDLEKDKTYIINHLLAYGGLEDLKWLFKVYSKETVRNAFVRQPMKTYTPSAFNFAKEMLLGLGGKKLDPYQYDINLPRIIRR